MISSHSFDPTMMANEFNLQPLQENSALPLQDFDDDEETLSLCDLPLNSNASDNSDDFSKEDQSFSSDQDFFEFFTEGFTASTYPTDDIIFCGKLIPYKGATVAEKAQNQEVTTKPKNTKNKSRIFPWKSHSFNKSRTTSSKQQEEKKSYKSCKSLSIQVSDNNNGYATRKYVDKYDFPMKKVPILATPMKSRWYLFAFGVGRFPMEMELSDMKMRQSRRNQAKMSRSDDGSEMAKSSSGSGKRSAKSLWGLLRVLGWKSHRTHAVVKASFGCIPRV